MHTTIAVAGATPKLLYQRVMYTTGFILPALDVAQYSAVAIVANGVWEGSINVAGSSDGINYSSINALDSIAGLSSVELVVDTQFVKYIRATLALKKGAAVTLKVFSSWVAGALTPGPSSGYSSWLSAPLAGFSYSATAALHGLTAIHTVEVLNPAGASVIVAWRLAGSTVIVESNINLAGSYLRLTGI